MTGGTQLPGQLPVAGQDGASPGLLAAPRYAERVCGRFNLLSPKGIRSPSCIGGSAPHDSGEEAPTRSGAVLAELEARTATTSSRRRATACAPAGRWPPRRVAPQPLDPPLAGACAPVKR